MSVESPIPTTTKHPGDVDILQRIEDNVLNDPYVMEDETVWSKHSTISKWHEGKNILLTGGTGFLGRTYLEKILRSCPGVNNIYLIIRESKGKDLKKKMDEMFSDVLFDVLKKQQPGFRDKIVTIKGDVSEKDLGLSEQDRRILTENVNIIVHSAATVRFDEKIKSAVNINIRGTKAMLDLGLECKNLASFVHVSTAYSNCVNKEIDEKFYKPPMSSEDILEMVETVPEYQLDVMTPKILGDFPNTYCLSKCIAEDCVREYGLKTDLPISIFRPSIVIATYREPLRGWANNLYGPTGVLVGVGTGVLRAMQADPDCICDLIPVDMCVAAIIATTWKTATNPKRQEPKIYNYVSAPEQPINWGTFMQINKKYGMNYPTIKCIWYYSFKMCKFRAMFLLYSIFLHFIPAIVVDSFLSISGQKPKLLKLYKKINRFNDVLSYFTTNEWKFYNNNTQGLWKCLDKADRHTFQFDMSTLDWDEHATTQLLGLRVYLVKDDVSTIPEAKIRWRRFWMMHVAIQVIVGFFILRFLWNIFSTWLPMI